MKEHKFYKTLFIGLLGSLITLSGCTALPTSGEELTTQIPAAEAQVTGEAQGLAGKQPTQIKPSIKQANQLMKKGERAKAAEMYYRSAFSYPSPQRERIMLQAAEISASLNNPQYTRNYLKKVPRQSLTPVAQVRYRYIESLLALHAKNANRSLNLLPYDSSNLPKGLRGKIELVRKRAINMGGKYPDRPTPPPTPHLAKMPTPAVAPSIQALSSRATFSTSPARATASMHQPGLTPQQQALQQTRQREWLTQQQQQANLQQRRQAEFQQQQRLQAQAQAAPQFIIPRSTNKIAVLLPKKGALGKVADEIYQGVKDAQAHFGPDILSKRYNVTKSNIIAQYKQAVTDGADVVVGPLDKDSLATLMAQPQLLSTPVLSLNYLAGSKNTPNTLYQFGLSPEDEAAQIADFAISRGQLSSIVMTPDSSWGKRLAAAFTQTYQQRGGKILSTEHYPNAKPSTYLKRVQKALRKAEDASMVFLAASPTQARLLRPLLKDQAGILPVYATSHIFSGRKSSNKDIDLDGIIYTEIPYVLNKSDKGSLSKVKFPRLYALGMDAVLIAKNLGPLAQKRTVPGQTGKITMDQQHRIHRRLEFATFINGQPHSLGN